MEVWVVWSGSRAGGVPLAVFSSRARAEAFMRRQSANSCRCIATVLNPGLELEMAV